MADSQEEVVSAMLCKRLTSHGVPVNATDRAYWRTALHGAAAEGDAKTIRYLVSKGANVNAIDRAGDSPLELAVSNHQDSASKLLADLGARKIRGDAAQRESDPRRGA